MSSEMPTESRSTSELVIESIADYAGVDPLELETPLGDVVDPDALDSLFTSPLGEARHAGTIEFSYEDYLVTVVSERDSGVSVDVGPVEENVQADSAVGIHQA